MGYTYIDLGAPVENVIYYCIADQHSYIWKDNDWLVLYSNSQGTIYGVKINGQVVSPDELGYVDLGTVITEHQDISNKANTNEYDGKISYYTMPPIILDYVNHEAGFNTNNPSINGVTFHFIGSNQVTRYIWDTTTNSAVGIYDSINARLVYYCANDNKFYKYKGNGLMVELPIAGSGSIKIEQSITASSNNPVSSAAIYQALESKQGTLDFDSEPTEDSSNPVISKGIYKKLSEKANLKGGVLPYNEASPIVLKNVNINITTNNPDEVPVSYFSSPTTVHCIDGKIRRFFKSSTGEGAITR